MGEFEAIVVHDDPIGRAASNYIARVDLSVFGLGQQVEQIWLTQAPGGVYQVGCVPFCVYGIAYRDFVRLDVDGVYVTSVVTPSGNRVLRTLIADVEAAPNVMTDLIEVADRSGIRYELHGTRLIAFNVEPDSNIDALAGRLQAWLSAGSLQLEWADRRGFMPPTTQ